jgi:hypothetical protein
VAWPYSSNLVLSVMNAHVMAENLLGRFDVSVLISVGEGIAHPDDGAGPYKPLGMVHMDQPEPTKAHTKPEQPSTPRLKPSVIKPVRLFPRRRRTATPPDEPSHQ